jgi:hypothetical protein
MEEQINENTYDLINLNGFFVTKGKQENFKNYLLKLDNKRIVNIYTGYHSITDLVEFLSNAELTVSSPSELIYWIKLYFGNWQKGINNRIRICEDYLLIKHIILEHFNQVKIQGRQHLQQTIEFINSINFEEFLKLVPTFEIEELDSETT